MEMRDKIEQPYNIYLVRRWEIRARLTNDNGTEQVN